MTLARLALTRSPARARRPAARDLAAAQAHFKQGKAHHEAGAWLDAVGEHEKAYALAPLPDLRFDIGSAYRMQNDAPRVNAAHERFLAPLP